MLGSHAPLVHRLGRGEIYAVMDGVGGAPRSLAAAQHIADRLTDFFRNANSIPPTRQGLRELLTAISIEINQWGMIDGTERPLGAAVATIAWFMPTQEVGIFHAGDTLGLHFDGRILKKLTIDHGAGRGLLRYFGQGDGFTMDETTVRFSEGDMLCLVTNGVTKVLNIGEIETVLKEVSDPEKAAEEIAQRARGKRSPDDITALVVQLDEW